MSVTEIIKDDDGGMTLRLPKEAAVKTGAAGTVFSCPKGRGANGMRFSVGSDKVAEEEDGSFTVRVLESADDFITASRGKREESFGAEDLERIFEGASAEDYKTEWYKIVVPAEGFAGDFGLSTRVRMPDGTKYAGKFTFIPVRFKKENDGNSLVFSVPEDLVFSVGTKEEKTADITAKEFSGIMENASYAPRKAWERIEVPKEAIVEEREKSVCLRLPKGPYEGFTYFLPKGMVKKEEGKIFLCLPGDISVTAAREDAESDVKLDLDGLKKLITGKGAETYKTSEAT